MMIRLLAVVVVAVVTVPSLALGQAQAPAAPSIVDTPSASVDTALQQEIRRKRFVVLPQPPMEAVVEDTERARDEIGAPARRDELIRESRERPLSRPELDYDVTSTIQARQLHRVLAR
jgi:hypothetical protein